MARLLLVTPARDEAAQIERTVRAVAGQTRPPDLWLVVDDGSSDQTPALLDGLASEVPFLRVLHAPQRDTEAAADRLAIAAEARAFNWALGSVRREDFTHLGKLDADVEPAPDYFERLLAAFVDDPRLGIAGGTLLEQSGDGWRRTPGPAHHVRGALKLYSSECLAAIGGVEERLGWDTIDEVYARMLGFSTRSLEEPTARHHRPVGSRGGLLRGRARHGRCAYAVRYSAWWVLLRSLKTAARERPYLGCGAAYLYGYARAALERAERVEDEEFRRFVAAELRRRALEARPFFSLRERTEWAPETVFPMAPRDD